MRFYLPIFLLLCFAATSLADSVTSGLINRQLDAQQKLDLDAVLPKVIGADHESDGRSDRGGCVGLGAIAVGAGNGDQGEDRAPYAAGSSECDHAKARAGMDGWG